MCGICGQLRTDGHAVDPELIDRMMHMLAHRGPDDQGAYLRHSIGLGHRRLSIIDLSPAGHQPMGNQDGTVWVVFNGEIYNFQELRERLERRFRFVSRTDTEVLLHLYEEREMECLKDLRGMFAFAIWDARKNRLVLARDRVGKKPLFYTFRNGALTFASELRALLADESLEPEIDPVAIHHYLTYQYVPAPRTIFKGVYKLQPAQVLSCQGDDLSVSCYWELDYTKKLTLQTEDDYAEAFLHHFREAVRLRLVSDVPLGAFLSGGIDSSSVVAMMTQLSGQPVRTFSIGFKEEDHNELAYARTIATAFGTDHREFVVDPTAVDILPKLVELYSEPFADSSAIPTYYVSKLSRQFVTVVLTGDGGDELFAGYGHHRFPHWEGLLESKSILKGWRAIQGFVKWLPERFPITRVIRGGLERWVQSPEQVYLRRLCYFDNVQKASLYTNEFTDTVGLIDSNTLLQDWFREAKATEWLDRLLGVGMLSYLPNDLLVKVDLATMAHGLEARCPFLDHPLIEFAASLPPELKLRKAISKYLMKKALGPLLPKAIVNRNKMGFGVPIQRWFREELRDYLRDILLAPTAVQRGYFGRDRIEVLIDQHQQGLKDHGYRLYALLMLELWHQNFVDQRVTCALEAGTR